jgi:pimeloyl-ACP methyl ester carboxylesterase
MSASNYRWRSFAKKWGSFLRRPTEYRKLAGDNVRVAEAAGIPRDKALSAAIDKGWANTSFLDGAIVQQPALFVGGDRDPSTKTVFGIDRQGPALRSLTTNFRDMREVIMLPGVGHTPPEERPEGVNTLLLKFLKEIGF